MHNLARNMKITHTIYTYITLYIFIFPICPRQRSRSLFSYMDRPGACIILDKKYNIANSSCHFGSYGSIWTGPSPKKYYMDLRSFGPYDIFLVTDRSIYCHITLSAMNYLLYMLYIKSTKNLLYFSGEHCSPQAIFCCTFILNVFITINCLRLILQNKQNKKCYLKNIS